MSQLRGFSIGPLAAVLLLASACAEQPLRKKLTEADQLRAAKAMLLDSDADDPHWVLDWVSKELSQNEQRLLSQLEPRLHAVQAAAE